MSNSMLPPSIKRQSSRSNSTSSSLITVKNTSSITSNSTLRSSILRARPSSPEELSEIDLQRRRSRSKTRSDGFNDLKTPTPNLNINRWSHSTSSSVSAVDTNLIRKQMQSHSRRMSGGPGFSVNGNKTTAVQHPVSMSQERILNKSPVRRQRSENDPTGDGDWMQGRRDRNPNPSLSVITPTSMYNTNTITTDYAGDTWHRRQTSKLAEPVTAMSIQYTTQPGSRARQHSEQDILLHPTQPVDRPVKVADDPSADTTIAGIEQRRSRSQRSPTQKTMLSKALAKANTAVLLDNAQNIDGAIEAYAEACDLLQQVMIRSSDPDDRKKLSTIRSTYSNRIAELHDLDDSFAGLMEKALPTDPPTDGANLRFFESAPAPQSDAAEVLEQVQIPQRQESLLPGIFSDESYNDGSTPRLRRKPVHPPSLSMPVETQYIPPALSPRRAPSANSVLDQDDPETPVPTQFKTEENNESTSWLDTVDDAESTTSSSRLSSLDFEGEGNQTLADEIEAEFDAALNAAVESAYDEELGAETTPRQGRGFPHNLALESRRYSRQAPIQPRQDQPQSDMEESIGDPDDDNSSDEEERLLEEMTRGYVFSDFELDDKSKSALPRQSNSSNTSNQTRGSSVPSTIISNDTVSSSMSKALDSTDSDTLEGADNTRIANIPHGHSSRMSESTLKPIESNSRSQSLERHSGLNLRDRRLSGQSVQQLKIETFANNSTTTNLANSTTTEGHADEQQKGLRTAPPVTTHGLSAWGNQSMQPITPLTSIHSGDSMTSDSPETPALTQGGSQGSLDDPQLPSSPTRLTKSMPPPPSSMKKHLSSSSLKLRSTSGIIPDESPLTAAIPVDPRKAVPPLPSDHRYHVQSFQAGGMYLFDDHTGNSTTPDTPRLPGIPGQNAPVPLEPCPESFLLRPFWLMRCLYQTIAHPRGGYVSTKLFIPRDIWRVKNVKLKMLDEKISQCDLLTAALLKLSKVDNLDADAVLEELTSFETVLDQVRSALQKKLGGEVGVSSSTNVFKSPTEESGDPLSAKPSNSAAKSFASGWRKLRSKSSGAAVISVHGHQALKEAQPAQSGPGLTMPSLPMTTVSSVTTSRSHSHRQRAQSLTPTKLTNIPLPHAQYMGSLARLFDAVQIIDSIARQVEDPGLKFSSKTHVGLELSVRNAAEFFAFYIIRFVMADLMLLVDKFLKRGTEWVLA